MFLVYLYVGKSNVDVSHPLGIRGRSPLPWPNPAKTMVKASMKARPLPKSTKPLLCHCFPKADTQPEPRVADSIKGTTTLPVQISKSTTSSRTFHQRHSSPLLRSAFRAQTSLEVGLVETFIVCSLLTQPAGIGSYRRCSTVPDMWRMPVLSVLQLATTAPIVIHGIPRLGPREVSSRVVVPLSVPS